MTNTRSTGRFSFFDFIEAAISSVIITSFCIGNIITDAIMDPRWINCTICNVALLCVRWVRKIFSERATGEFRKDLSRPSLASSRVGNIFWPTRTHCTVVENKCKGRNNILRHVWNMIHFLSLCMYEKICIKIVMRYLRSFEKNQFTVFQASNLKAQKKYDWIFARAAWYRMTIFDTFFNVHEQRKKVVFTLCGMMWGLKIIFSAPSTSVHYNIRIDFQFLTY